MNPTGNVCHPTSQHAEDREEQDDNTAQQVIADAVLNLTEQSNAVTSSNGRSTSNGKNKGKAIMTTEGNGQLNVPNHVKNACVQPLQVALTAAAGTTPLTPEDSENLQDGNTVQQVTADVVMNLAEQSNAVMSSNVSSSSKGKNKRRAIVTTEGNGRLNAPNPVNNVCVSSLQVALPAIVGTTPLTSEDGLFGQLPPEVSATCPVCKNNADTNSIQCDTCLDYFHPTCQMLSDNILNSYPEMSEYHCIACRNANLEVPVN